MPDGAIARVADCRFGKALVRGLEFLQAHHIGSRFGQPFDQPGQAGVDSIDVESCDLQIRMPPIGRRGRLFARPQIEKDEPQPQPEAALGLRTWKAAPPSDSEKSTSEPSRRSRLVGSITSFTPSVSVTRSSASGAVARPNL